MAAGSLPCGLGRQAYTTGGGELLWSADMVPAVVRWAQEAGLAVSGGEVYAPLGPMSTMFVSDWETSPLPSGAEDWGAYVARSAAVALGVVAESEAERGQRGRAADVRYFLALSERRARWPESRRPPVGRAA